MPGFLLDVGALVQCAHGGKAELTFLSTRVKVMGKPIVSQSATCTITGCPFPPPPVGNGPCVTANWVMGALRVKSMGVPVLLQDSQAICLPTDTPLFIAVVQRCVKGV
jgi:hypothetical protein